MTIVAGAWHFGVNPITEPEKLYKGFPFAFSLMSILLTHELGHYFAARKHGISATLPYFIPAPHFFGTFGAFIKIRHAIVTRPALLDIGAAGPLAGFVVACVALLVGLQLSEVHPPLAGSPKSGELILGNSLILTWLTEAVLSVRPDSQEIIVLHPVGLAGWIGLFITSLNLLPIGQLDGGHILYAMSGRLHSVLSKGMIPILLVLGYFGWPGWIMWSMLVLILGTNHPPVTYPTVPLDKRRRLIGWLCLIVFILTFMPEPIRIE
jgi:membrane-associated protease RseP (regulator of RpoE activity)